jgi:hypothetical protein
MVKFDKILDRTWFMRTLTLIHSYDFYSFHCDAAIEKLKEDYNVTAHKKPSITIGGHPDCGSTQLYNLIIEFDNEADEAEFIVKTSDGIDFLF